MMLENTFSRIVSCFDRWKSFRWNFISDTIFWTTHRFGFQHQAWLTQRKHIEFNLTANYWCLLSWMTYDNGERKKIAIFLMKYAKSWACKQNGAFTLAYFEWWWKFDTTVNKSVFQVTKSAIRSITITATIAYKLMSCIYHIRLLSFSPFHSIFERVFWLHCNDKTETFDKIVSLLSTTSNQILHVSEVKSHFIRVIDFQR